jgi:hypothetical protein
VVAGEAGVGTREWRGARTEENDHLQEATILILPADAGGVAIKAAGN